MMSVGEARRRLHLSRRELQMTGIRLGAVANARGKRDPKALEDADKAHENAARKFAEAEADLRIAEAGTETT